MYFALINYLIVLKKANNYFQTKYDDDIPEGKTWAEKEFKSLILKTKEIWDKELLCQENIAADMLCEIVSIKKKLNLDSFDFKKAFKLLLITNRWLSLNFSWDNWGKKAEDWLKNHKPLNDFIHEAEKFIEAAFYFESMWLIETSIERYKNAYITVNRIYNSKGAQLGFREMLPSEKDYYNPFEK